MRIWEFSPLVTVLLDIAVWFCLHMFVTIGTIALPVSLFHERQWLYRPRSWEREGRFYNDLVAVKRWKKHLPDGSGWFKAGFSKKRVAGREREYLNRFVKETCRGELTHWIVILLAPLFFLWNLTYVGFIMIGYALLSNLPCIIVQRYNRPSLIRLRDKA